jgi:hypothetical protein
MERNHDWGDQAADAIESVVLTVKEKATVPLVTAARAVVFGLVVFVLGIVLAVLAVIGVVRVVDVWLLGWAGRAHGHVRLWVGYVVLGMLCTVAGLWCWSRSVPQKAGNR